MSDHPVRPQTPQPMIHSLPDKKEALPAEGAKPSKYIILITASIAVAGKVQIAKSVANVLSCPLFQGDSLHETSAKAASVGVTSLVNPSATMSLPGVNQGRYQRMWLSKMTRTGYLFPEESRPANKGFSGFGGAGTSSSTSTSRRGSNSSNVSVTSDTAGSAWSIQSSVFDTTTASSTNYTNKPPTVILSGDEKLRRANPALMVVTHPQLEQWHKDSIRKVVGEFGIGVIFIPLNEDQGLEDEELPVLKPLDPRTMTSFASLGGDSFCTTQKTAGATLEDECVLRVNTEAKLEDIIEDIVDGVREIMDN